jgi:hypothetical protein
MKMAVQNGAPVPLASLQDAPNDLTVDSKNVYWTNMYGGQVMQVPIVGGPAITIASGQQQPAAIAVDAANIYWAAWTIRKAPLGGGAIEEVVPAEGVCSIAVDPTSIYWADCGYRGQVMRALLSGGAPIQIDRDPNYPSAVFVNDQDVFWLDNGIPANNYYGAAVVVLPHSSNITTLAQADWPSALAFDGSSVYFTTFGRHGPGAVAVVPRTGGQARVIAAAQNNASGVAVDAKYVYWTADGKVLRVAK